MKIVVERSGGFAGVTRTWTARAVSTEERARWEPVVAACPWDAVPAASGRDPGAQPDRFVYRIRAGAHRATLPERELTGPWRELVDLARADGEAGAGGQRGQGRR